MYERTEKTRTIGTHVNVFITMYEMTGKTTTIGTYVNVFIK
jgi:hypothetical protein